ncbi:bifunctional methylenetetrahydrofolate dehydrogenase/methenyltetrahydrofolate cyclohydrolase [Lactovum miscens]|uniref:Bifunctional protein FolD n=1 Tax=Lactovum miscens TaxID=190387 RepID=A0A841C9G7_9LACT|nr:bifunctional methylenetetrahydrofolate dehydrogenase/methenyltetrahydrofolate cyclohydrolase [Lactovum miscens]MBB5888232.1 methylenetetrahydrofolate dehydrogenase (NADP+)/methenyltetrahydrofolate cyclohydrolase [Lactovum miscens]
MTVIDGKALAERVQSELKTVVASMPIQPGLVAILVGDDPASKIYVSGKEKDAAKIGIKSEIVRLPETITEVELLETVEKYNQDSNWHGIIVQLPLPKHINEERVLMKISPEKDVDGFHPTNMGLLWSGHPLMLPSTPAGIMEMLKAYNVEIEGKNALVIGRSNIVGKPIAQLLLMANATVTIAHSRTKNLLELVKNADILVVAIGQDRFIKSGDVKPGAVVIDVGMNRDAAGKLHGDVDFNSVKDVASLITPVPGGVGLMTRTMLMKQTVEAAKRALNV